jgi:Uma2 family endonuclease
MITNEAIMNVRPNLRMSKAAFIEWDAAEGERCELVDGGVVMMPRPSRAHALIVVNLAMLLRAKLDPGQWDVIFEFGLDTGPDTLRYPDIVVDRAGGPDKSYTATSPVLLAEVLSPSTAEIDLGDKAAEYQRIPSLLAYLVLSQDEPKAWVYLRTNSTLQAPELVSGIDAAIHVAELNLDLQMAGIYAGTTARSPPEKI